MQRSRLHLESKSLRVYGGNRFMFNSDSSQIQPIISEVLRYYSCTSTKVNEYVLAKIIADKIINYIKENNNE